ncbi:MAG: hypothetical protein R2754_13500 [Microthrixaceae bacterium]
MAPFDTSTDEAGDPEFGADEPRFRNGSQGPAGDEAPSHDPADDDGAPAASAEPADADAEPDDQPTHERGRLRGRIEGAWEEAKDRRHHEDDEAERFEREDPEAWANSLLAEVDPKHYFDAVSGLARSDQSSMLTPLEFDPDVEFHYPQATFVDPEPQGVETVQLYARTASPIFDDHLAAAFADPARADLLADIHHRLMIDGRNLALVTNHGDIVDIAMVLAGLTVALCDGRTYGVLNEELSQEELAEHCNIMVSRMVTTRAAFGLPAISVVTNMARIFLSLPQTHSRRRARLDPKLVRASNVLMRADLDRRIQQGGQLLAMAASGSQDLSLAANFAARVRSAWQGFRGEDHDGPSLHLQPLYAGTMKIMLQCADVLPLAVCMDPKRPGLRLGSITRVRTEDDCHRVMDWIASAHEDITGVTTVYHDTEDDLLTNIRAAVSR